MTLRANPAQRDPLEGLQYAFGVKPLQVHWQPSREPHGGGVCKHFLAYANAQRSRACVRCGRAEDRH
jgi:hypothetical protein